MIRKAIIVVAAVISPFVLLSPLQNICLFWAHISIGWVHNVGVLGRPFLHLVYFLPCFAVSAMVGLALGIVKTQQPLRLAWIFGISMFVANGGMVLDMAFSGSKGSEWYYFLFHVGHVFLPIAVTTAWLRRYVRRPGHCKKCGYDLTGNVSGVCPECGKEI